MKSIVVKNSYDLDKVTIEEQEIPKIRENENYKIQVMKVLNRSNVLL